MEILNWKELIVIPLLLIFYGCGQQTMKDEGLETKDISAAATTTTVSAEGPPTVSSVNPADSSNSVSVTTSITITFNESIYDTGSIMTNSTSCTSGNYQISTSVSYSSNSCLSWSGVPSMSNNDKTLTIQPSSSLNSSTTYYLRIGNNQGSYDIKDYSGTAMSGEYTWSFTTQ